jgi:hypothetical protein
MAVKVETAVILLARPKLMKLFFSSSSVVFRLKSDYFLREKHCYQAAGHRL